ncbi:hypothetical protein UFOVP388_44 [uncultured Caudovirales phage]|uniref:Uncharacterized protein n=1 Tax=uncultured Caudovirales phage TaxID=2100421 RepID=A0A6J7X0V4_9CAUD|nr:hypothetical protein UFOVP388_44 [uncultured Caudovirales phage]
MACDLSLGRLEPCKSSNGGIVAAYFITSGLIDPADVVYDGTDTDLIDSITGTITAVKYDLRGTNTFEQTVTSSRENGTTFVEQKLSLMLKKLTVQDHKELKLLCYGRPQVVLQDNNGNYFFLGLQHGLDVTTMAVSSGTALGDFSGYKIELVGMEPIPANFLAGPLSSVIDTIVTGD